MFCLPLVNNCRTLVRVTSIQVRNRTAPASQRSKKRSFSILSPKIHLTSFSLALASSMSRDRYAGSDVTSRSSVAMTTSFPVATTTLTTACPGQCATVASAQCDVDEDPNDGGVRDYSCPGSPSDPPSPGPPHKRRSASDASDDDEAEMNVDSPDSGFESATPSGCSGADYFDDGAKSDAFDEVPKASSAAFAADDRPPPPPAEEYRLCLIPPKPQPPPSVKGE